MSEGGIQLDGLGVVITGAGRGIGAALARKFAAAGARLVVNDMDADAVRAVGAELGVAAVVGDAASAEGIAKLLDTARAELGAVDMYCANAGVAPGGGPEADEDSWELAWEVNVLAHVRAVRALLPDWLARGRGHFLATVSAAGLLSMLGSAPYSVTKHAALAHAEWLAATYRHRGITVHALCPQGVRTDMLGASGTAGKVVLADSAIEPSTVADMVADGLAEGRFLLLPHPEVAEFYVARATDTDRWLGGMNKLQRRIESAG
ncbi:short-subunit dehydrogenase [Tamaricihabitans halophyticus]|uniref:Short-subunit dehydrogenase n=1 Tax=Tamaricihabitans halophyticus TaxID=1262583 RepID=A0A4R2QKW7_9PSEU|nr:SDR family oxidoreductase [Tamaricihabitans halophyticus]TCP50102.1 short-subunit dehydrogenase [Tamaricihabitans halophyticus]